MNKIDGGIFSSCINKGVPIDAPILIFPDHILSLAYDPDAIKAYFDKAFNDYMRFLRDIVGVDSQLDFYEILELSIDKDTLEKKIIFSPCGFMLALCSSLNIDNYFEFLKNPTNISGSLRFSELDFDKIRKRIIILGNLKSTNELKREFPALYEKYLEAKKREETFKKLRKCDKKSLNKYLEEIKRSQPKEYISLKNAIVMAEKGEKFSFDSFLDTYVQTYVNLYKNIPQIFEYLSTCPIDFTGVRGIRKSSLELYLAYEFVSSAKNASQENIQDFLYYVSNYFSEHKNKDDFSPSFETRVVGFDDNGARKIFNRKVTPNYVYKLYRDLLIANPNLRAIDFSHFDFSGFNADEVKDFMDTYLKDLAANWEILDSTAGEQILTHPVIPEYHEMSEEEKLYHRERLMQLFMEKKEFYDSSDPYFRIKGKNTFDGYIGFIYPNGRVVLDKFYENSESKKLADGHAVYAMGIDEFYELSRLSKTELIRNKLCNRYIHQGSWQDKVRKNELMAASSIDVVHEVKQLVKTGEVTGFSAV